MHRRQCATRCVWARWFSVLLWRVTLTLTHPPQREKLEEDYRERKRRLEEWEQRSKRALEVRERELERELYQQRQGVLRELESVRAREKELQQGAALESKTLELERERMEEAQRHARERASELERARVRDPAARASVGPPRASPPSVSPHSFLAGWHAQREVVLQAERDLARWKEEVLTDYEARELRVREEQEQVAAARARMEEAEKEHEGLVRGVRESTARADVRGKGPGVALRAGAPPADRPLLLCTAAPRRADGHQAAAVRDAGRAGGRAAAAAGGDAGARVPAPAGAGAEERGGARQGGGAGGAGECGARHHAVTLSR